MLRIEEEESEYVEDFADTSEIGEFARGDIYEGEKGVAFYLARWFSERKSEIELLVVLVPDESSGNRCSLAFRYGANKLELVEPSHIWTDWSPIALPLSRHEANTLHLGARDRALQIAEFILEQDRVIRAYAQTCGDRPN